MRGRKTLGPELVQNLDGSQHAKRRLEVILRTLTGELTIAAAGEHLGIQQAQLNVIRRRALQAAVCDLEPRRRGRPPTGADPAQQEVEQLKARIIKLEQELEIAAVRAEVSTILTSSVTAANQDAEPETQAKSGRKKRNQAKRKSTRRKHRTRK